MTKHVTPPTSGPFLSGYSANENAGDTTQIRGTKNPTQARTKSPVSSGVFRLAATLTLRLRRPCGARMTTITSVAASTSAFATHGFMAEHRPVSHRTAACLPAPASKHPSQPVHDVDEELWVVLRNRRVHPHRLLIGACQLR